ncbi:molybdenum ABC transporter ATP-binding protein [Arthrobacter sp. SW1]|uniref:sulfate/molybdate ABC transporter ATP-binding protein n=1 Tax=Arthrobacter sp. SW1 TaxID=1920889 RepID=UPI000877DAEA|nr:ATP-binding cassette domain-containing protein [Arthrobacter sp. SW1]OFI38276.1 molybdenum ABC transporter ATP-binding protein [Arthrobacter sp. SW1]
MSFTMSARVDGRLDAALTVAPGETVAVFGPNGAGKSTLLAVAAGLLRPDAGSARLGDRQLFATGDGGRQHRVPPHWFPPHRRGVALLAQEALLFPHLSVLDNVAFAPRSGGKSRAESRKAARHWLGEVDALELAERRPAQLSGGQAQRVAVARALAAEPELLLLDEPMAALDIHAAPQLRRVLKRVLAGRSAVIVTHDVLDALMLADRVVVLERGRVSEEGPVREVLGRPRSAFAAGLAGLNLMTGTVTAAGLLAAGGQLVTGTPDGEAAAGEPGVAAFPPSAVSVFLELPHGSPRNCFPVTVTELEPHAGRIRVRAGELSADITPAASAELGLEPGMRVFFVVKSAEVQVYGA